MKVVKNPDRDGQKDEDTVESSDCLLLEWVQSSDLSFIQELFLLYIQTSSKKMIGKSEMNH